MKFIFGICILFFFGLEGFAIAKKVPTTAIDSTEKAKAAIDSIKAYDPANKEKVKEELADVLAYAFMLAEKYNFDVKEIVLEKIKRNGEKYPIDKAKGIAKKYNEL